MTKQYPMRGKAGTGTHSSHGDHEPGTLRIRDDDDADADNAAAAASLQRKLRRDAWPPLPAQTSFSLEGAIRQELTEPLDSTLADAVVELHRMLDGKIWENEKMSVCACSCPINSPKHRDARSH